MKSRHSVLLVSILICAMLAFIGVGKDDAKPRPREVRIELKASLEPLDHGQYHWAIDPYPESVDGLKELTISLMAFGVDETLEAGDWVDEEEFWDVLTDGGNDLTIIHQESSILAGMNPNHALYKGVIDFNAISEEEFWSRIDDYPISYKLKAEIGGWRRFNTTMGDLLEVQRELIVMPFVEIHTVDEQGLKQGQKLFRNSEIEAEDLLRVSIGLTSPNIGRYNELNVDIEPQTDDVIDRRDRWQYELAPMREHEQKENEIYRVEGILYRNGMTNVEVEQYLSQYQISGVIVDDEQLQWHDQFEMGDYIVWGEAHD